MGLVWHILLDNCWNNSASPVEHYLIQERGEEGGREEKQKEEVQPSDMTM